MNIVLNGQAHFLPDGASVAQVVAATGAPGGDRGVAVAIDGMVVARGEWERVRLAEGQRIEVVQAVQGG